MQSLTLNAKHFSGDALGQLRGQKEHDGADLSRGPVVIDHIDVVGHAGFSDGGDGVG